MPSPFPGMDPWLERPAQWHNMHRSLITLIYTELNLSLPEGFAATMVEVSPLDSEEEQLIPFIQIVATTDGEQRVVTVIEVLSPINKTGQGREQYRAKQRDVVGSSAHLLEIDLLRGGQHTVAVPENLLFARHKLPWDYVVCLHRAGFGEQFTCWPFTVRDSLPMIVCPLADAVPEQALDLGALFSQCYDTGPFRRMVDYVQPPTPRLSPEDALWAKECLTK